MGGRPQFPLQDGIQRTYDWFLFNVNELREVN